MAPFVIPMVGFILLGTKIHRGIDAEAEKESSLFLHHCAFHSLILCLQKS